jgi:hypothetical protein
MKLHKVRFSNCSWCSWKNWKEYTCSVLHWSCCYSYHLLTVICIQHKMKGLLLCGDKRFTWAVLTKAVIRTFPCICNYSLQHQQDCNRPLITLPQADVVAVSCTTASFSGFNFRDYLVLETEFTVKHQLNVMSMRTGCWADCTFYFENNAIEWEHSN